MDLANSVQLVFQNITIKLLENLGSKVSLNNLCLSGGCALNGVTNAKILNQLPVKKMFIQPAASDDGTAIGSFALLAELLVKKKILYGQCFLGFKL